MAASGSQEVTEMPLVFPPKLDFEAMRLKMERKTPISFLVPPKANNARRPYFGTGAGRVLFKEPTTRVSQTGARYLTARPTLPYKATQASARLSTARRLTSIPSKAAIQNNHQRTLKVSNNIAANDGLKRKTVAVRGPLRKPHINNVTKNNRTISMIPRSITKENRAPDADLEASLVPLEVAEEELQRDPSVFQPRKPAQKSNGTPRNCCCVKDLVAAIKTLDDKMTKRMDKLQQAVDRLGNGSGGVELQTRCRSEPDTTEQTEALVTSPKRRSARLREKSSSVYHTLKKSSHFLETPAAKLAGGVTPTPMRYSKKIKSQLSQLYSD